jgi:hypothetical protein
MYRAYHPRVWAKWCSVVAAAVTCAAFSCSGITIAQSAPAPDPGLAALAARLLPSISTVPFDGALRHYRGYIFDTADHELRTAYGKALRQGVPSSAIEQNPWAAKLAGVATPNELLDWREGETIFANVCKPHDCPDHAVYALFEPATGKVWGLVHLDDAVYVFGNPSASEEALLLVLLGRLAASYNYAGPDAFPLSRELMNRTQLTISQSAGNFAEMLLLIDRAMMG